MNARSNVTAPLRLKWHTRPDGTERALFPALESWQVKLLFDMAEDDRRDPLVIWNGLLLDGHNRYEICQRLNIPFSTVRLDLKDRRWAINWIIENQLGRRNLHPDQASYLRGKRYNGEKQEGFKGNQHTDSGSCQNDKKQTHERLAEEYKVSPRTIARDGQYAAAVDKVSPATIAREGKRVLTEPRLTSLALPVLAPKTPPAARNNPAALALIARILQWRRKQG